MIFAAAKDTREDRREHRGPRKFQKFQKKSTYVGEESSDPVQIRKQVIAPRSSLSASAHTS